MIASPSSDWEKQIKHTHGLQLSMLLADVYSKENWSPWYSDRFKSWLSLLFSICNNWWHCILTCNSVDAKNHKRTFPRCSGASLHMLLDENATFHEMCAEICTIYIFVTCLLQCKQQTTLIKTTTNQLKDKKTHFIVLCHIVTYFHVCPCVYYSISDDKPQKNQDNNWLDLCSRTLSITVLVFDHLCRQEAPKNKTDNQPVLNGVVG